MSGHPQQGGDYDGYGHGQPQAQTQAHGGHPNDAYYQDGHYDDQYYDDRNGHGGNGGQGYYDEA